MASSVKAHGVNDQIISKFEALLNSRSPSICFSRRKRD
jgi:hypothetical protein